MGHGTKAAYLAAADHQIKIDTTVLDVGER